MLNLKPLKSGTDVRGTAMGEGCNLTNEVARALGAGFAAFMKNRGTPLKTVAMGRDSRLSGEALLSACADGLRAMGVDVTDFGLCTTPAPTPAGSAPSGPTSRPPTDRDRSEALGPIDAAGC